MRKLYLLIILLLPFARSVNAQVADTILFEDFQFDVLTTMAATPTGNDQTWVNYDQDGLPSIIGSAATQRWYFREFYSYALDSITGVVNYCASSYSFLQNSLPGNRNWLITPPINVTDANFTLHWKSASYQGPRYLDGYLVMAAINSNLPQTPANFADTLFKAASMQSITGNGQSTDISNFEFTPGYIHADGYTLTDYFIAGATIDYGLLEPHSVSLAAYSGKTIYLAFLHNSDDDTELALDDILVQHQTASPTVEAPFVRFHPVLYPNPVENVVNVLYELPTPTAVTIRLYDMQGALVATLLNNVKLPAGEQQHNFNLRALPAGSYSLEFSAGDVHDTKILVKK
ncbi:MAG: T9SS type A sorting domain-containing protein [Bacteroidota bacterium]